MESGNSYEDKEYMTVQGLIDKLLEYDPENEIAYLEVDRYGIVALSIEETK